ncbi:MAG TPA: hypothetical protein VE621_06850, partial [Bryobacteraceae bacterium]|nr:hypothetical protein [Bryobacteraceae bacterium]
VNIQLPNTPGMYQIRYYSNDTFTVLATSTPINVGVAGFSVAATGQALAGRNLTFQWTAGAGMLTGDCIALVPVGAASEKMVWYVPIEGRRSGTGVSPRTLRAGTYELRYLTQGGYVTVAKSAPIIVK